MTDKASFRAEIKALTARLSPSYLADSDWGILQNVLSLPEFQNARRVFLYISFGREPDTHAILSSCEQLGKPVAAPTNLRGGHMDFALLTCPLAELPTGACGIPQPTPDAPLVMPEKGDLVIVPGLCFDESFYRLGRGGGYYDRFLSSCPAFKVGLCREALLMKAVPTKAHDERVDCLITEKKTARP